MNQSAILGGALLAGFALFVASRNRLSVYGRILWGEKPASHSPEAAKGQPVTEIAKSFSEQLLPSLANPGALIFGSGAAAGIYMQDQLLDLLGEGN